MTMIMMRGRRLRHVALALLGLCLLGASAFAPISFHSHSIASTTITTSNVFSSSSSSSSSSWYSTTTDRNHHQHQLRAMNKKHQHNDKPANSKHNNSLHLPPSITGFLMAGLLLFLSSATTITVAPTAASAAESRLLGEIRGSGLVFKDTLNVESFDDPKVKGVTLYITNFARPLTERISRGDFFSDPSSASVGCAKTGPVEIADNIALGKAGEEVFEESKSLLFKTLRVQRLYDKEKNTVVYVSFNTRLDKNEDSNKSRFKSSICAVNLD